MKDEPAFPNDQRTEYSVRCKCGADITFNDVTHHGMTLRDYFAAKAMAALISGPDVMDNHYDEETNEYVAVRAYFIADAMLEARKK